MVGEEGMEREESMRRPDAESGAAGSGGEGGAHGCKCLWGLRWA